MQVHINAKKNCSTCCLEAIRKQRNSVHPHLWSNCTEAEFDSAAINILLMQHVLVHCEASRIADFPDGVPFEDIFTKAIEEETRGGFPKLVARRTSEKKDV